MGVGDYLSFRQKAFIGVAALGTASSVGLCALGSFELNNETNAIRHTTASRLEFCVKPIEEGRRLTEGCAEFVVRNGIPNIELGDTGPDVLVKYSIKPEAVRPAINKEVSNTVIAEAEANPKMLLGLLFFTVFAFGGAFPAASIVSDARKKAKK
jgi:hypothetical protein